MTALDGLGRCLAPCSLLVSFSVPMSVSERSLLVFMCVMSVQDTLAVVADADGQAARPPLNLPSKPMRLAQGGMCIIAGGLSDICCGTSDKHSANFLVHMA